MRSGLGRSRVLFDFLGWRELEWTAIRFTWISSGFGVDQYPTLTMLDKRRSLICILLPQ